MIPHHAAQAIGIQCQCVQAIKERVATRYSYYKFSTR